VAVDPKIILEHIILRLAPEVGDIKASDYGYWEGELPVAAWRLHLATALTTARQALASGDHDQIIDAALICPSVERTGRSLKLREMRAARQRQGGTVRGAMQTTRQLAVWHPYIDHYNSLRAKGMPSTKARGLVRSRMTKDFARGTFRPGPAFPTDRTIRKWLTQK